MNGFLSSKSASRSAVAVDGSSVPVVPSSLSPFDVAGGPFDFMLTPDMWDEFVDASNDDGYGMKKLGLVTVLFFGSFGIVGLVKGGGFSSSDWWFYPAVLLFVVVGLVMMFSHRFRHINLMADLAPATTMWFDVSLAQAFVGIGRPGERDWPATPCRLEVTERGLRLYRWPGGRMGSTVVPWGDLRCVRVTGSLVVVSPSARGKFHVDWLAAYPTTRNGDVDNCVMVARSALPDEDGFVRLCRANIERALAGAEPPGGWRGMVYRLSSRRGGKQ